VLADRIGVRKVVLPGLVLIIAGMAVFTQVGALTPYWQLLLALFVIGMGMGSTMMPIMTAALQTLTQRNVARATTAMNIVQQAFGAIGSAVMSIILAGLLAGKFGVPTSQGQLTATLALRDPRTHDAAAAVTADSFASTFVWALVLIAACLIPALFLPKVAKVSSGRTDENQNRGGEGEDEDVTPPVMLGH
jgi:MFS family permease